MKIQWLGHACFKITHNGYSVVIDPYDAARVSGYPVLKVKADKLLVSHEHLGHNYRKGVILSGRPESDCPFEITSFEVPHDGLFGRKNGMCKVHILKADGLTVAHMGDIGGPLSGNEEGQLFGIDALMIGAGSYFALPSQDAARLCDDLMPKVVIPMHYHDPEKHLCSRKLERIDDFVKLFPADLINWYKTDIIEIGPDTVPQVAVLNYLGGNNGDYT